MERRGPACAHAVHEQTRPGPSAREAGGEVDGCRERGEVERRRDEIAPLGEEPRRLAAAVPEAVVKAVERPEEIGEVGEETEPEDPVRGAKERRAPARGLGECAPEESVAPEEEAQGVVLEESHETLGRRQKIEAAGGRRRIEHEEVDVGIRRVLVERQRDAQIMPP